MRIQYRSEMRKSEDKIRGERRIDENRREEVRGGRQRREEMTRGIAQLTCEIIK